MPKILVKKYVSEEDRAQQKNGIVVGEATSYDEFLKLVAEGVPSYCGYTDERGQQLDYEQVERRFGRPKYSYHYYWKTGKKY